MSQNSDRARVQNLLNEGRITAAEAEILFAALDDVEGEPSTEASSASEDDDPEGATIIPPRITPEQVREEARARAHETAQRAREKAREAREKAQEARDKGEKSFRLDPIEIPGFTIPPIEIPVGSAEVSPPPTAETPRLPQPPTPPSGPQPARGGISTYPSGTRWAKISGFCGDLDVRTDPNISEPGISGNASFNWDGKVLEIRTPSKDREGGRNWLNRLHRAAGDLKVTLPEGMGLELAVAAGDGSVRGVREVHGNFTGGDFNVYDAETIDLTATAGDVNIRLRPTTGQQRLRATSGDINLTLLSGSSVKVSGKATCGDLDLPKGFNRDGGFGTQRFSGTVGAGEAELELRLTAGDVDVKLERT